MAGSIVAGAGTAHGLLGWIVSDEDANGEGRVPRRPLIGFVPQYRPRGKLNLPPLPAWSILPQTTRSIGSL
jgi:hypothetical protein